MTELQYLLRRISRASLGIVLAALALPLTAWATGDAPRAPLIVQSQGSFAVGGTIITAPGPFDPSNPGAAWQTLHGDHAYGSYQVPVDAGRCP